MTDRTVGSVDKIQIVSHELPYISPDAVERTHVLDTIAQIASDDAPVVFVEGEAGCGSTTLMAQFCIYQKEKCFYLFVKPASRFSYSLDYLRLLLAEQFASYLGKELSTDQAVDVGLYDALLLAVKKKKGKQPVFFVIDGLQQVPDTERSVLKSIFTEVLPIGVQGFRFLITVRKETFERLLAGVKSKNYQVQKMSDPESRKILFDIDISELNLKKILKVCRGLPGRLASVRRIIKNDSDAEKLLSASLNNYPDFISIELQVLDDLTDRQKLFLALLSYSRYPLSRQHLLDLSGASESEASEISEKCQFVTLQDDSPYSDFESETYRIYADRKLENFRGQALNLQIEYLANNPSSSEAVQFLPAYYQSLNQQQAILDLLNSDHYSRLLDATNSINALRARAAVGAKSAMELKQAAGIFQFALQRSIFFDVACGRGFQSRVGALVALGRSSQALDLAAQAPTNEMRLKMLSEYARRTIESGRSVDAEVIQTINDLAQRADLSEFPEETESLAENVAFFDTDLAMSLLDKMSGNKSDVHARDRALVKLSFAAANSSRPNSAIFEKTRSQVSDERHRSLIAFIASYFGGVGLAELKIIAETLSIDRRIFFLRCVLAGPKLGANALELVDYALGEIVSNASYLPKVRDLADFATPLTYAANGDSVLPSIIKRFEAQLGLVERSSGSIHLTDLTIKLAIGESHVDMSLARRRVLDAYFDVSEITTLEIKVECLALLLKALKDIDVSGVIENEEGISQVLRGDLLSSVTKLLENTASHFEAVRGSLKAIAEYDVEAALRIAAVLNTVACRDDAYQLISETMVRSSCESTSSASVLKLIKLITEGWRRDRAIAAIVRAAVRGAHRDKWSLAFCYPVTMIIDPNIRAETAIEILQSQAFLSKSIDSKVLKTFNSAATEISSDVDEADLLFRAATAVARADVTVSSELYERAEEILMRASLNSESATTTISVCLSLLLRASRIIIKFGLFDMVYLERFSRLCEILPDRRTRIAYYVDLATKAACENKIDLAKEIIARYCNNVYT
ncbi:MAG: NACHT domain-containing protein, partial [Herbaspirillum sp.]